MDEDVAAPAQDAEAQEFKCPQCAGTMHWDAAASGMRCLYCDHVVQLSESEGNASVVEYDLEHGLAMMSARGYGTPVKTTTCQSCGATVSFGDNVTATRCDFCDSPQVMEQTDNRNVVRPESLVPFAVERQAASDKFGGWLRGLWFRPSDLKHLARVDQMHGVYVPYWTFDATVDSAWNAQSGYYYYETEWYTATDAQGNTSRQSRQVRKTRWHWSSGARTDAYDDVLICASRGLPTDLADRLRTFDTRALVVYEPRYLSGWKAEEYAVELNAGWKIAVDRIESSQRGRCARDVPGDTHRFLSVNNRFRNETFKHVLLPIWISAYRYKDEIYRFLVNGQTGEVTGKAPYSWIKIALFVAFLAALVVGGVILYRSVKS